MSADNPFESFMKMGQDWAKSVNPGLDAFIPDGLEALIPGMSKETLESFIGKGLGQNSLDAKTRLLITIMGLTVSGGTAETQIRLAVKNAVEAGATRQEVAETIGMGALFGGVPAMTKAMATAMTAIEEDKS